MLIQSKVVTVLVTLFFGCSVAAREIENCNRVQFSFDDQNSINKNQNFTKQFFEKNGQPVYYSFQKTAKDHNMQTIIWQNSENNYWLSQTRPYSGNNIIMTKTKISQQNFKFGFLNE